MNQVATRLPDSTAPSAAWCHGNNGNGKYERGLYPREECGWVLGFTAAASSRAERNHPERDTGCATTSTTYGLLSGVRVCGEGGDGQATTTGGSSVLEHYCTTLWMVGLTLGKAGLRGGGCDCVVVRQPDPAAWDRGACTCIADRGWDARR